MRSLVLVAMLAACESATPTKPPEPAPPKPPGPRLIETEPPVPPVRTLPRQEIDEIHEILLGRGTFDPKRLVDPNKQLDPRWDPTHAWLVEYRQHGQAITIRGEASSMADVVQFAKRLAADVWFEGVVVESGERVPPHDIYRFALKLRGPKADPNAPLLVESTLPPKPP